MINDTNFLFIIIIMNKYKKLINYYETDNPNKASDNISESS